MGFKELFLATLKPLAKQDKPRKHSFTKVKVVTNPELLEEANNFIFSVFTPKEESKKEERVKIRTRIKELCKEPPSKERDKTLKELRKLLKDL